MDDQRHSGGGGVGALLLALVVIGAVAKYAIWIALNLRRHHPDRRDHRRIVLPRTPRRQTARSGRRDHRPG